MIVVELRKESWRRPLSCSELIEAVVNDDDDDVVVTRRGREGRGLSTYEGQAAGI